MSLTELVFGSVKTSRTHFTHQSVLVQFVSEILVDV